MQEGGNESGAVSEQRTWQGYAQIALVVVALVVALYFARAPGFREPATDSAPETRGAPPVVEVVVPSLTEQALTIDLTGSVTAKEKTTIMSEVEGRIVWVSPAFTNGGFIAAGDTILRIDPAKFELEVEEAQAVIEGAEARVWNEEVLGAENERVFELENPDAEPSAQVRRLPNIALARAELKQAQVALKLAELRLERTHIALPYDVRVLFTDAAVGEWANPADPPLAPALLSATYIPSALLGIVYPSGALQVEVSIEPRDLAYLEPAVGRPVRVTGRMGSWTGAIVGVSSLVNPISRLASVYIDFAADESVDSLPSPGAFVEVSIEGPVFDDVYVLPNAVLQEDGGIWIVRDDGLHWFKPETYGRIADGWVVNAFDAGKGVMASPLSGAHEGLEVSVQASPGTN